MAHIGKAPVQPKPEFLLPTAMPETRPPDIETFARQFKAKYGLEMTTEERKFYQLTKNLLDNPPEDADGNAA